MSKALLAVFLGMLSAMSRGQSTSPAPEQPESAGAMTTLKVSTRVVAISAVVKSKAGEPIGGLTKDDFVLKQDGKEEAIHYFSQGSELPLTLALMVDTSGSQRTFIGDETAASDVFFETMLRSKEDRAMLVQIDAGVQLIRGLTNSPNALHLSLLSLDPRASRMTGTLLNDAVYAVSKSALAKEKGRKAMVILSDGGDNGSHRSIEEAIEQAQRGDVQVYSILYSQWAFAAGRGVPGGTGGTNQDPGRAALQKLSESTGGRVFQVSPMLSLREIYAQIGEDLRLQYELGYTPPANVQPNSYHKLELRAKDKKLLVQARRGFFAQP